jgi:2-methylisocitrate lyase-like PEP mutase family enzyme
VLIVAPTDTLAAVGFGESIARAYAAAGADTIFVEAPETTDQIRAIARSVDAPLRIKELSPGGGLVALEKPARLPAPRVGT